MGAAALLLLNSMLNSALGLLVEVQSVSKMVFCLPSALPCTAASTSSSSMEKYVIRGDSFPENTDKQFHIKTCYLQFKDYSPPLPLPTKREGKKKKKGHQILNAEILRKEQQVKDSMVNSFPDCRGSALPACAYACPVCSSG